MECKRCGTKLRRINTPKNTKNAVKNLGIPFGGTFVCPLCYQSKGGMTK